MDTGQPSRTPPSSRPSALLRDSTETASDRRATTHPRPNLFVIGAMKCGSTQLARYLASHPQIFMCEPKEPHFFVEELNWSKGWSWYQELFATARGFPVVGEASVTYSMLPFFQGVPQRIAKAIPDARFLYIMRDPIERTISHYWHMVRWHGERREMLRAIRETPRWREYSNYAMQLEPYFEVFGRERIYPLSLEALAADAEFVMADIFRWLGVPGTQVRNTSAGPVNATPLDLNVGVGLIERLRFSRIWDTIRPLVPRPAVKVAKRLLLHQVNRSEEPLEPVIEYLRPIQMLQVDWLSTLLNRRFPEWRTLYNTDQRINLV